MTANPSVTPLPRRCPWCGTDSIYVKYHDEVWGVPVFEDRQLFEFLVLETAQAGLSWITILKRQPGYRHAFADFDIAAVAAYSPKKIELLLQDTGIIRNRRKIESAVNNAQRFIAIQNKFGSFSNYYWQFTDGVPLQNCWRELSDVPANTELSVTISRELRKRGFQFVGPTVMYAFMQATGMVNDHLVSCYRHREIQDMHTQRKK